MWNSKYRRRLLHTCGLKMSNCLALSLLFFVTSNRYILESNFEKFSITDSCNVISIFSCNINVSFDAYIAKIQAIIIGLLLMC